jgi:hypothetical protein
MDDCIASFEQERVRFRVVIGIKKPGGCDPPGQPHPRSLGLNAQITDR